MIALAVALARLSSNVVLTNIARFYISIIRGTPLLVQLFIVFYALPEFGEDRPFPAAIIAFSLNVGGYAAEIIRSAIQCPKGQWEAAETIGIDLQRRAAAHHPAPGRARRGAAAVQHVDLAGQGHLSGVDDLVTELLRQAQSSPRRRSSSSPCTARPRSTTGDLPGAVVRASRVEHRLERYVAR